MRRNQTSLDTFSRDPLANVDEPGPDECALIDAPEAELVRRILKRAHLFPFFDFMVSDALGFPRAGWQYFFATEVERTWLGLPRGQQPGDVDVLIVPIRDKVLHVGKAAAIEVKRLVLRDGKIGRNVDRYGITQAQGLLRDGFPYVGILHIVIAQTTLNSPLHPGEAWQVIDDFGRMQRIGEIHFDRTAILAAQLQIKRLIGRNCDPRIGINSVALQLTAGERSDHMLISEERERAARPNPKVSRDLLANIAQYVASLSPTAAIRD